MSSMMHQDIEVRDSQIHGKGLFAKKLIPKGTVTWIIDFSQIKIYTEEEYYKLSNEAKANIYHYGWDFGTLTVLFLDDARFENHSDYPNCDGFFTYEVANRDIGENEEITVDYHRSQGFNR